MSVHGLHDGVRDGFLDPDCEECQHRIVGDMDWFHRETALGLRRDQWEFIVARHPQLEGALLGCRGLPIQIRLHGPRGHR